MHHEVICTAGHIDHGKTALIKALTGMDTDRLQEEKLRGITIDLGFAFYDADTTIIDVPGHEKFIKNMVAGAATVDFAILVVAADEGTMPQTREHLDILSLLDVKRGMIVLSKADLVDDEWLELVTEDVLTTVKGTFLEEAPIVIVDSLSGRGIDEFRKAFDEALKSLPPRETRPEYRQPIDRSFTIKGFGTVITGTVISGEVSIQDIIELLPNGKQVKVRGIQVHGKDCSTAITGTRAALNLSGVEKWEAVRGDILAAPGFLSPADRFDCQVKLLKTSQPLLHRERLRFHLGTAEIIGQIILLETNMLEPGTTAFAQLELEKPIACLRGDRFIFRTYSPQLTIGGGMVLRSAKIKHKRHQKGLHDLLNAMSLGDNKYIITHLLSDAGSIGLPLRELLSRSGIPKTEFAELMKEMYGSGKILMKKSGKEAWYTLPYKVWELRESIVTAVEQFHHRNPALPGMSLAQLKSSLKLDKGIPFIEYVADDLVESGMLKRSNSLYSLPEHKISLSERQKKLSHEVMKMMKETGLSSLNTHSIAADLNVEVEELQVLMAILESLGKTVRLYRYDFISCETFQSSLEKLREVEAREGSIKFPEALEALRPLSRRVTAALLEHLDHTGITECIGKERKFIS